MQDQAKTSTLSYRRWTLAGIAAATVAAVGAGLSWHAHADAHGLGFGGRHGGGWEQMDPEAMSKRIEAMVAYRLADIDATPEQKAKIASIMQGAANDLSSLRGQGRELRRQSVELLTAPSIDRAQLEALRVQQSQLHETVSRRMLQAIADAAEVLTPEQRAQVAEKMHRRHRRG
jgi:Spy/CpxP family protein refolding chaperone